MTHNLCYCKSISTSYQSVSAFPSCSCSFLVRKSRWIKRTCFAASVYLDFPHRENFHWYNRLMRNEKSLVTVSHGCVNFVQWKNNLNLNHVLPHDCNTTLTGECSHTDRWVQWKSSFGQKRLKSVAAWREVSAQACEVQVCDLKSMYWNIPKILLCRLTDPETEEDRMAIHWKSTIPQNTAW